MKTPCPTPNMAGIICEQSLMRCTQASCDLAMFLYFRVALYLKSLFFSDVLPNQRAPPPGAGRAVREAAGVPRLPLCQGRLPHLPVPGWTHGQFLQYCAETTLLPRCVLLASRTCPRSAPPAGDSTTSQLAAAFSPRSSSPG